MPKGIQFDHAGNMEAVNIGHESIMADLNDRLECRIASPLEIHAGLVLWIDAESVSNGHRQNPSLTKLAAILGLDFDGPLAIHGPGIFLGGTATTPASLAPDQRMNIVLKQLRSTVHSN